MLMDPGGGTVANKPGASPYGRPSPATTATGQGQSQNPYAELQSMFQGMLGQIGAGAAQQQAGIDLGSSVAGATQQTSDQQLLQNFQDTLASLGLQQTGLGQEQAYQGKEYGFEQQQQGLSRTGIEQGLANLGAQYGLQQQGFGLQTQQAGQQYQQGLQDLSAQGAASGTAGLASSGIQQGRLTQGYQNTLKQLGLSEKEAAQGYKYGQQQGQQQLAQLGLTGQEQAAGYQYQQQQLQNALQGLGLQRTEAGQQYTTGKQQDANTYLSQMAGLLGQQGQIGPQEAQQIAGLYSQLFGTAGG